MSKYTVELPEIEGYEQALNEDGSAMYRKPRLGDSYRQIGCSSGACEWSNTRDGSVKVFILKKKPREFQFGDLVADAASGKHYYVYMRESNSVRLINREEKSILYFSHIENVLLIEDSTEISREKTIEMLNGVRNEI